MTKLRLGVNIDHVATVRNARGEGYPDPVRAAEMALAAGSADGITAHLPARTAATSPTPTSMRWLRHHPAPRPAAELRDGRDRGDGGHRARPSAARSLPGSRTPRGDHHRGRPRRVAKGHNTCIAPVVQAQAAAAGIRVSCFIDADLAQVAASCAAGAQVVQKLHTGAWCQAVREQQLPERRRACWTEDPSRPPPPRRARLGLEVHAVATASTTRPWKAPSPPSPSRWSSTSARPF